MLITDNRLTCKIQLQSQRGMAIEMKFEERLWLLIWLKKGAMIMYYYLSVTWLAERFLDEMQSMKYWKVFF